VDYFPCPYLEGKEKPVSLIFPFIQGDSFNLGEGFISSNLLTVSFNWFRSGHFLRTVLNSSQIFGGA